MRRRGVSLAETPHPFIVGTAFQESYQTTKKEKEQLQAELDTTKRVSRTKDQQISRLQEDLWTMEEKMMQKQKSKCNNDGVGVVSERTNMLQYYQYCIHVHLISCSM